MAKEWNLPYMRKDGIKFRILRGYPGGIIFANTWQPKYHHMYLYKKEVEGVWNKPIERRSHVKTEAEIRVLWPQANECQQGAHQSCQKPRKQMQPSAALFRLPCCWSSRRDSRTWIKGRCADRGACFPALLLPPSLLEQRCRARSQAVSALF